MVILYHEVGHCLKKVGKHTNKQKITLAVCDVIVEELLDDKKSATGPKLQAAILVRTGVALARSTVPHQRHELGWVVCLPRIVPMISKENVKKHYEFAKKVLLDRENFDGILFTDSVPSG